VDEVKVSAELRQLLRCPVCRSRIDWTGAEFRCAHAECAARFPVVDGVPVLLNEARSVFSIENFVSGHNTTFDLRMGGLKKALTRLLPAISRNLRVRQNLEKLAGALLSQTDTPRILVVGGSILGQGMEVLASDSRFELVETDVSFGPRTTIICDGHDIPFEDGAFDAVIVQAVLEHVADPYRCVEEIHRVLKERGVVYAETPFMQQVHMGQHDFTRFTHLGHRRLFRRFDEIDSGAACGPGMALAWSYQYFLMSFASSRPLRALARAFARCTSFFLKYFDYYLINKPGVYDAASAYYFIGQKGDRVLSDRELVKLYRGRNLVLDNDSTRRP